MQSSKKMHSLTCHFFPQTSAEICFHMQITVFFSNSRFYYYFFLQCCYREIVKRSLLTVFFKIYDIFIEQVKHHSFSKEILRNIN